MASNFFGAIALTGGGTGSLDAINGNSLNDGDGAIVIEATLNTVYLYTLDSSSGASESSPDVIEPDSNAGDKRWIRVNLGINMLSVLTGIAAALKTGADAKLVTGTKGTANDFPIWNADGDIVGSGLNVAETGVLATAAEWTAQQNFNEAAITDDATGPPGDTAWDLDTAQCAVHILTANTEISAPSNMNAGGEYSLRVVQAAGIYTLAWNAVFDWGAEGAPVAPAANGDVVIFKFYSDGSTMYGIEFTRTEA